jgi:hypothetical protein
MTPAAAREILEHALRWADTRKQLVVKIDVEDAREMVQMLDAVSGSPVSSPIDSAAGACAALDSGGAR